MTEPFSMIQSETLKKALMETDGKIVEIKKWEGINPKKEPLTIPKLKELMKRPEMSDAEAQEIIFAIEALVSIIVQFQMEEAAREKFNQEQTLKQAA